MNVPSSGDNWQMESPVVVNIDVIEPPDGKRRKKGRKEPYGFARAIPKKRKKKKKGKRRA